ncbi:hypothetical protein MHI37_04315 [Paenibacillus sp. FSL H8-0548]|nr:hypothetical protein [Paenibacillus sp. FSL H8-0548]
MQLDMKAAILTDHRLVDYTYVSHERTGRINRMPDEHSELKESG